MLTRSAPKNVSRPMTPPQRLPPLHNPAARVGQKGELTLSSNPAQLRLMQRQRHRDGRPRVMKAAVAPPPPSACAPLPLAA